MPRDVLVAAHTRLIHRRHVGKAAVAFHGRHRERPQLSRLDVRNGHQRVHEKHVDVSRDKIDHGLPGPLVRNRQHIDAGHFLEIRSREQRSRSGGRVGDLTGLRLGEGDQSLDILRRY
ncbi:hypothetical protein D3C83_44990 [compost metagenome]